MILRSYAKALGQDLKTLKQELKVKYNVDFTRKLGVKEMNEFILNILVDAAEQGIYLETPDDLTCTLNFDLDSPR